MPDAPRLMTRQEAAAYCNLKATAFSTWVASGLLPRPLPGTRRWDRRKLDIALDQLSGIKPEGTAVSATDEAAAAVDEWLREQGHASAA
jgi:hypothetical protein